MLIEARNNLAKHTSLLAEVKEQAFNEYSTLEKQRKETQKLDTETRIQNDSRMDLRSLQVEYELLRLRAKEAEQQKKLINT